MRAGKQDWWSSSRIGEHLLNGSGRTGLVTNISFVTGREFATPLDSKGDEMAVSAAVQITTSIPPRSRVAGLKVVSDAAALRAEARATLLRETGVISVVRCLPSRDWNQKHPQLQRGASLMLAKRSLMPFGWSLFVLPNVPVLSLGKLPGTNGGFARISEVPNPPSDADFREIPCRFPDNRDRQ